MAHFTTTVRSICESKAGLDDTVIAPSVNSIIEEARPLIFDFDYPIFDAEYKPVLEKKILRHYYTREIGLETYGLWKMLLETRLNEIMPYYNKLYESELLEFEPLTDTDYTRTGNREGERTGTESGQAITTNTSAMTGTVRDERDTTGTVTREDSIDDTATSNGIRTDDLTRTDNLTRTSTGTTQDAEKNDHWDYYSDTPQGSVNGLQNLSYLTNARHVTDDGTGSTSTRNDTDTDTGTVKNTGTVTDVTTSSGNRETSSEENSEGTDDSLRTYNTLDTRNGNENRSNTSRANSTEEYLERVKGKMGRQTYMSMIKELRDTFLNIDLLIIRDLNDLFMGLWE